MLTAFRDSQVILLVHFLKRGVTVPVIYYCNILSKLRDAIDRKYPRFQPDTLTQKIEELRWKPLKHPTYSLDLAPRDYHLFGPLKLHTTASISRLMQREVRKSLRQPSKDFTQQALENSSRLVINVLI
ncbi:hypothetical protein AVEN_129795-1 [Araneus ventricosus]|uniref:Uncharacterized protein n=1 Tax=Araneus ventricosus TaxID=182803 RepID=A0A4Y2FRV8_ARAVE|nr:hypothetical protein AVEN_129795-1 [Araneus ventricosus]